MKIAIRLAIGSMSAFFLGCGDSGDTGAGGSTSATTTTTTTTTSTGASTDPGNCTEATATDKQSDSAVTIDFGGTTLGNNYSPACLVIKAGTTVTWTGNFVVHPLHGGIGDGAAEAPIGEHKGDAAGSYPVTFTDAGTFSYECEVHGPAGMQGTIYVK